MPFCTQASIYYLSEQLKIDVNTGDNTEAERTCIGFSERIVDDDSSVNECAHASSNKLVPVRLSLTRGLFERLTLPLFDRSMDPIVSVMIEQGVSIDDIDEVVMVGGSSRMPRIRDMVREELDMEDLNIEIDPDITVAFGCASVID